MSARTSPTKRAHDWFAIGWKRFQCIRCAITIDDGRPCAGSYQQRMAGTRP